MPIKDQIITFEVAKELMKGCEKLNKRLLCAATYLAAYTPDSYTLSYDGHCFCRINSNGTFNFYNSGHDSEPLADRIRRFTPAIVDTGALEDEGILQIVCAVTDKTYRLGQSAVWTYSDGEVIPPTVTGKIKFPKLQVA